MEVKCQVWRQMDTFSVQKKFLRHYFLSLQSLITMLPPFSLHPPPQTLPESCQQADKAGGFLVVSTRAKSLWSGPR